jgi:hypothetical protein
VVAVLYAVTMMLMGLSMALSWRYLARHEQLVSEPAMAGGARRALLGGLAYVFAIVLAPVIPAASLLLEVAIAVYQGGARLSLRDGLQTARVGPCVGYGWWDGGWCPRRMWIGRGNRGVFSSAGFAERVWAPCAPLPVQQPWVTGCFPRGYVLAGASSSLQACSTSHCSACL